MKNQISRQERPKSNKDYDKAAERAAEMSARWVESERILTILRTRRPTTPTFGMAEMEKWYSTCGKNSPANSSCFDFPDSKYAPNLNDWFVERFREEVATFGAPFLIEQKNVSGRSVQFPSLMNQDCLAACLGGERGLGHHIIYYPGEDSFFFLDPKVDAYCPTSDEKMQIFLSNLLVRCAEACIYGLDVRPLLDDFRKPAILRAVVNKAKTILEADPSFFESVDGKYRYIDGRRIGPALESSPVIFIKELVGNKTNGLLGLGETYAEYRNFCLRKDLPRLTFGKFKETAREAIYAIHKARLRHDLVLPDGVKSHGWKNLTLLSSS